jgi:hypothetical protein
MTRLQCVKREGKFNVGDEARMAPGGQSKTAFSA